MRYQGRVTTMKYIMILAFSCLVAVPAFADGTPETEVNRPARSIEKSRFEHSWKQRRGVVRFGAGDYEVLGGDAEKSMDDCMRAFEGSSTPPSCLSGITVQRKPPTGPPAP